MIAQISGCLLIITILSLLKFRPQFDRIVSVLFTISFFVAFYFLAYGIHEKVYDSFSLLWDSSPAGDVRLEIISSSQTYLMVLPFFAITGIALFNNLFFRYEIYKKSFTSLLSFNLFCLIMLICGNNFIQMITFVFIIDIASQLFIKNIEAGRNYALYNLAADMALFGVLAILSGQLDNLSVEHIRQFYQPGRYGDFVALLLMSGLFIKFGFGFYRLYLKDLKNVRFHRLIFIPYLSSPAAALVLFVKLHPLLTASEWFLHILNISLALATLYGAFGVVKMQSLKEKTIFLDMMLLAYLLKMIERTGFIWEKHFSWLLVLGFVLNLSIYYLHYYSERNIYHTFTGKLTLSGRKTHAFLLLLWLLVLAAFSAEAAALSTGGNALWIGAFPILLGLATACMFDRVLKTKLPQTETRADITPYPVLMLLFLIAGFSLYHQRENWIFALWQCVIFVVMLLWRPFKAVREAESVPVASPSSPVCAMHFLPLRIGFAGLPWLIMTQISSVVVAIFRKFNRLGVARYIFLILSGVLIFIWCFGG